MPMRQTVALAALLLFACSRDARSAPPQSPTVILELFTSQGCSSCPPADRLLTKLGAESFEHGRVIPLAYHVDYWDSIGWRDPFSSKQWTKRQTDYARTIQGSQVYTPQLVIGGTTQLVGSAEGQIRKEIDAQFEQRNRGVVKIDRATRIGNEFIVELHARTEQNRASVIVALFENGITTAVQSGENAHRTLTNNYIVRWERRIGDADANGFRSTVKIPLNDSWKTIGVAAFLQEPSLAIVAADARTP